MVVTSSQTEPALSPLIHLPNKCMDAHVAFLDQQAVMKHNAF